jgi:hypothetical protein
MTVPEFRFPSATLIEVITYLAAVDDEDPEVPILLIRICRLARHELPQCDAVSITYAGDHGVTTLEADPDLVRVVDAAQYADDDGPCLRALREGYPAWWDIDTSITWSGFRAQSRRLGLHSALAVPLFTAASAPVASLNLWSRSPAALEPLHAAVVMLFDAYAARTSSASPAELAPGERQLTNGLRRALELRTIINKAVGCLIARHEVRPDEAFELLRARARSGGTDIARTAGRLLIG